MKPNGSGASLSDEMWTVKDVANFMRVHPHCIYRFASIPEKKGGIPKYRIGSAIRIPKQKFMAWLAKGTE